MCAPDVVARGRMVRAAATLASILAAGSPAGGPVFVPAHGTPVSEGVREGGFSDLASDPTDRTGRTFWTISDRGPNTAKDGSVRFPHPDYHQKILRWRLDSASRRFEAIGIDSLATTTGGFSTGLPSARLPGGEEAWTGEGSALRKLEPDSGGYDFEGLAPDGSGGFWLSDEYGPRLVHAVLEGRRRVLRTELSPGAGLPSVLATHQDNKGMEGLARLPSGRLVGIMQSPLGNGLRTSGKKVAKHSRLIRMVSVDPTGGRGLREYAYLLEPSDETSGKGRIGACTALDEHRLLVVEIHKSREAGRTVDLWIADFAEATDLHADGPNGRISKGLTLEELAMGDRPFEGSGILPVRKTLVARDVARSRPELEGKAEGLALLGRDLAVLAFDDDFGIGRDPGTPGFLLVPVPDLGRTAPP